FQAEDGIRDGHVTGVQTCALPIFPFTPAGEAAAKYNQTETYDPESLCIIGGTPRHHVTMMPFEILQGSRKTAFLYGDGSFRLIKSEERRVGKECRSWWWVYY